MLGTLGLVFVAALPLAVRAPSPLLWSEMDGGAVRLECRTASGAADGGELACRVLGPAPVPPAILSCVPAPVATAESIETLESDSPFSARFINAWLIDPNVIVNPFSAGLDPNALVDPFEADDVPADRE